jgi:heat shock protein HslJ
MTDVFRLSGVKLIAAVSVAIALTVTGGCGEKAGVGRGELPALPEGHTFLSAELRDGGKPKALVDGSRIRLSFNDGELRADAGCNALFGHARLAGGRLVVDSIGGTEMGCRAELVQQDEWLSDFLTSKPSWQLDGDELTLTSGDLHLRLLERSVAEPDRSLRGTRWVLDTIIDGDTASSVPNDGRMQLKIEGERALGYDGCNGFDAREVVVKGSDLRMSDVRTQSRGCRGVEEVMARAMSDVLWSDDLTFRIDAGRLTLETSSGKGLGFHAR